MRGNIRFEFAENYAIELQMPTLSTRAAKTLLYVCLCPSEKITGGKRTTYYLVKSLRETAILISHF